MPLTTLRILVLGTGRSVTQQGNSPNGLVTLDLIRRENSASPYRTECQKYVQLDNLGTMVVVILVGPAHSVP